MKKAIILCISFLLYHNLIISQGDLITKTYSRNQLQFAGPIFINEIPDSTVLKHTIFYHGDTLDGFDYNFWILESKKENIKLMYELKTFMHQKQDAFVKAKYNLEKLPWEIAKANSKTNQAQQNNFKVSASACGNIDFEDGNLNSWVCSSGYNPNSNASLVIPGSGLGTAFLGTNLDIYACKDVNLITSAFTPSNDPIVNPALDPSGGTTSIRLGGFHSNVAWNGGSPMSSICTSGFYWDDIWSNGQEVAKTINVSSSNSLLSFDYAVVLNDGGHSSGNQPYFHVIITNTLGTVLSTCTEYYVQAPANSTPPGFVNSGYVSTLDGSILYYKSWTSNSINLSAYLGQTIIVKFSAAGCTQGAHCSWAYVDAICTSAAISVSNSNPCPGQNVTLTAPSVVGGSYVWTGPSIVSGANNQSVIVNGSGNYSVTVTPSQGASCSYNLIQTITYTTSPTITASATSPTLCNGSSTTLNASGGSTYSWSGGVTNGVPFNPSATNNYTVIGTTALGCTNTAVVGVTVISTPVAVAGATTSVLNCTNTSITLNGSGGGTYNWTGPGIVSGGATSNPTINLPGSYGLQVSLSGCTSTISSLTITQNTTNPTFTLGTASTVSTTCASPNATLSGSSSGDPNTIYTWITPTSSTITGNPIVSATPGIYSVIVTNTLNGCKSNISSSTATVLVVADSSIPSTTLSSSALSITCKTATVTTSLTSSSSNSTYSWSPSAGILSGANTSNPIFNMAGTYSAIVTNTNNNCSTSANSNVVTVTADTLAPTINFTSSGAHTGTLNCVTPSIVLTPTISPSSNLNYTWSPTAGISSNPNLSSATFTAAGIYVLSVTNTLTGCTFSVSNASNTFTIFQTANTLTANVSLTSSNSSILCSSGNTSVTYSANTNASGSSTFIWAPTSSASNSFTTNAAGIYTLIVIDGATSCTAISTFTVIDNTAPPQNLSTGGSSVAIPCGLTSTTLLANSSSTNTISYVWNGPTSGSISSGSNTANPTINQPGIYTVTATDNVTGCVANATVNVIQGVVVAGLTANPLTGGIAPLDVNFTQQCQGATNYLWNFGNGNPTSTLANPTNQYTQGGTYTVTLIASSGPCSDTAYVTIIIEDGFMLEIPNVFTPNGDNSNDQFIMHSKGVKEFELKIFNRWGEKLYEYTGPKAEWDGNTGTGAKVPDGTYFFMVKAKGFDNNEISKQGTVNLFR